MRNIVIGRARDWDDLIQRRAHKKGKRRETKEGKKEGDMRLTN